MPGQQDRCSRSASQWQRYAFREKYLLDRQGRYVEDPKKEGQSIKKRGVSGQRVSVTLSRISPEYVESAACRFAAYSLKACSVIRPR
jgi:hypothetical protein